MVEDLVTPLFFTPIFKKLKIEKLEDLSWHGVLYGKALARFIDFLLTAFIVFLVIHYL
jgi:large conductance mechanosensitive channel